METMRHLTDEEFLEHDCYILFERLILPIQGCFVEGGDQSITRRIDHVISLVEAEDSSLPRHLTEIEVIPSMFLLRWLRLLLSRELPVASVFFLWDRLFLQLEPAFPLLDYLAAGLLLSRREGVLACGGIQEALALLQDGGETVSVRHVWALAELLWQVGDGEGMERRRTRGGSMGRRRRRARGRRRGCWGGGWGEWVCR